jgi:hypothetical protein
VLYIFAVLGICSVLRTSPSTRQALSAIILEWQRMVMVRTCICAAFCTELRPWLLRPTTLVRRVRRCAHPVRREGQGGSRVGVGRLKIALLPGCRIRHQIIYPPNSELEIQLERMEDGGLMLCWSPADIARASTVMPNFKSSITQTDTGSSENTWLGGWRKTNPGFLTDEEKG